MNTHAIGKKFDVNGLTIVYGTQQAVLNWFRNTPGTGVTAKEYKSEDRMVKQLAYHKMEQPNAQYVEIA